MLLCCGGIFGILVYVGATGPGTQVYVGSSIPQRFQTVFDECSPLEPGEEIDFFYSDQVTDIRGGYYLVTDRRVIAYREGSVKKLLSVPYSEIEDVDLKRDERVFFDSQLTIFTNNNDIVEFPLSSEFDRDVMVFESIQSHIEDSTDF